jgi:tetratricopeptide (TPR) repeat protein
MKHSKSILILVGLFLFLTACKNKTSKQNPALAAIDFKRGELLLCGDGQFGELKFSLSCNYETRKTFDLAVALLHSFQYTEAEKAFVKVIDTDPSCPMAYWGVAMSIYHAAWFPPGKEELAKGFEVLKIAKKLSMDDKQRAYINAIDAFYTDWETLDHSKRAKRFESKMEGIYLKYPEDVEAAIFYSLALFSTRDRVGKAYENERKAGKILESLYSENPNHPGIAHYIIHNYDNPVLAEKGLETARRYAGIAPASSHAQHMPSHIFTRLGLWQESIESNLLSAESARCYTQAAAIEGAYFEELHAIDYLVYAYLQKGDNTSAEQQYDLIKERKTISPMTIIAAIYPITAVPARLALENKNWKLAANLELQEIDLSWKQFPWQEAIYHFAVAMGAANTNDFNTVERKIEVLKNLHQNLIAQNDKILTIQIKQIEIQFKTAQAWLYFRRNDLKNGLTLMQEAAEIERATSKHPITPGEVLPAIELLGDMFLELNRPEEALAVYEENLKGHPGRFNGIYGAAIAAKKSGNLEKTQRYFNQLIELTKGSSSNRVEITEAKEYLKNNAI